MDKLVIGIVRTSFGVRGFFKVKSLSGETDHFMVLENVVLSNGRIERSFTVESVELHAHDLVMKLEGIDGPEEAKKYAGFEILVDRSLGSRAGEGDFLIHDLCTCKMVKDGRRLGEVRSVCEGTQADLLEVEAEDGKLYMIPFMDAYVGRVDIENREIELKADWLLE